MLIQGGGILGLLMLIFFPLKPNVYKVHSFMCNCLVRFSSLAYGEKWSIFGKVWLQAIYEDARKEYTSGSKSEKENGFWSRIQKLKVPWKVKQFLWRVCTDSLRIKINLVKRKILSYSSCHLCVQHQEDILHALWGCEAIDQNSVEC